ncbi:hypothetical protein [Bacillus sp. 2205SS5-2]|uniref:hypothetical protein n=1 Tax=Bacillus sp. 2205SS5-2 TaxID=3109031 RepID=UPI0030074AA1
MYFYLEKYRDINDYIVKRFSINDEKLIKLILADVNCEALSNEFFQRHTAYKSFDHFVKENPFIENIGHRLVVYNAVRFDEFVQESTKYLNFEDLLAAAYRLYV